VSWIQVVAFGPGWLVLILLLGAVARALPIWQKVKLREMDIREGEGKVRENEAAALTTLAGSISTLAESTTNMTQMMETLSIHQRKSTEELQIMQRVNADSNDRLISEVRLLSDRVDRFEAQHPTDVH
jgi:tellurite resistance-related uncharacterized protein